VNSFLDELVAVFIGTIALTAVLAFTARCCFRRGKSLEER
jgi:hypothetical protein